nr:immunoglobulin heavy chain junction region [Macaca mulatta]MOY19375.1 immunoglobulin heavy chain junction region [Macaca mulatta]MOY20268.1 immunoglobulin heavy chain junction region [Macaca mulatta]
CTRVTGIILHYFDFW